MYNKENNKNQNMSGQSVIYQIDQCTINVSRIFDKSKTIEQIIQQILAQNN